VIKTIKYPSLVVQTCSSQIQDDGQSPFWKYRKIAVSQERFDRLPRNCIQQRTLTSQPYLQLFKTPVLKIQDGG